MKTLKNLSRRRKRHKPMRVVYIDPKRHYAAGNPYNPTVEKDEMSIGYKSKLYGVGGMCCLGFYGASIGIDKRYLMGIGTPTQCAAWPEKDIMLDPQRKGLSSKLARLLMSINDFSFSRDPMRDPIPEGLSYEERMGYLITVGLEHGIEFRFVGFEP